MASSKLDSLNVRGSSSLTLNKRFSQLTQTKPKVMTSNSRMVIWDSIPLVLLSNPGSAHLQGSALSVNQLLKRWRWRRRRSVWSRLAWQQVAQRRHLSARSGCWNFRNKYKRPSGHQVTFKRRAHWLPVGRSNTGRSQLRLQSGGIVPRSAAARGRGRKKAGVPSKKQLDAQLDEYMSTTRCRLDKDLDDYMSLSKRRLDAELDEYMSLAGQSDLCWQ